MQWVVISMRFHETSSMGLLADFLHISSSNSDFRKPWIHTNHRISRNSPHPFLLDGEKPGTLLTRVHVTSFDQVRRYIVVLSKIESIDFLNVLTWDTVVYQMEHPISQIAHMNRRYLLDYWHYYYDEEWRWLLAWLNLSQQYHNKNNDSAKLSLCRYQLN